MGAALLLLGCTRAIVEDPNPPEPAEVPHVVGDLIEPEPEPAGPEPIPAEVEAVLGVIAELRFTDDHSGTIDQSSYAQLEQIAAVLLRHPELRVEIRAHHDTPTADRYRDFSMKPTQREAEAVRHFLINRGVEPDRLTAYGYADSMPLAPNDTAEGRALNRRVELVLPRLSSRG